MRLLIVDDNATNRRVLAMLAAKWGMVTREAENGAQALALLRGGAVFGLALLDMFMPGMDGVALATKIHQLVPVRPLPLVLLSSADVLQGQRARAGKLFAEMIAQPVRLARLAEVRASFLVALPELLAAMRSWQQVTQTTEDKATRVPAILALYRLVHGLAGNASVAGVRLLARLASAFEALLKELNAKQNQINASTVRTIGQAIHFLGQLCERAEQLPSGPPRAARIMAVDDEQISRRAGPAALGKAELPVQLHRDPVTVWEEMAESHFDLVIVDIDMPHLTGFELCRQLRALPAYAQTPVISVTSLHDFQSRVNGAVSGADDLIAKPFLLIELGRKALTHVLRSQVPKGKA